MRKFGAAAVAMMAGQAAWASPVHAERPDVAAVPADPADQQASGDGSIVVIGTRPVSQASRRDRFMTRGGMLKFRIKREAEQNMRAAKRLDEIAISIAALGDEDLLDLADIFRHQPETPIFRWASTEMARRKITL